MKKILVLTAVFLALAAASCKPREPKTTCIYGNDIPEEDLAAIMEASDAMMSLLEKEEYRELYALSTEEMQTRQPRDMFVVTFDLFTRAFGKLEFPKPEEVYYLDSEAREDQVWIPCNLGQPGVNDLYGMPANRKLAVAVYKARTEMEIVRVIFQLELADGKWKFRSLSLNPATIKHQLPQYYSQQALKFRQQNLLHLAVLYYKAAILLSDLGININEFTVKVLADQMNQIKVDYMPGGQAQVWAMPSGAAYNVYNLDTAYDNGNFLVHLSYMTTSLEDKDQLEKQARELAQFTDQKFPEYRQGFDGFRITAASEKKEEALMAYHSVILFKDLPAPGVITPPPGP